MPRNTQGGKNFKKFKTGSEGFRSKASREAVDDMIDLVIKQEQYEAALKVGNQVLADKCLKEEDKDALRFMLVGRVTNKFGNARIEAFCHDGKVRQCKIRGLLRKKGQVFIDKGSLIVVSLRESESTDEERDDAGEVNGTSDVIGCFDDRQCAILRKTKINPKLFVAEGEKEEEDLFDRDDIINAGNTIEEEEVKMSDL